MAKCYKGNKKISQIEPTANASRCLIRLRLNPGDINHLQKIVDGHSHLGYMTPTNPKTGLIKIHTTPDTYEEMITILSHFPRPIVIE